MTVYLPIAEMSVSILMLLALGAGVGFLGGVFGVGGGFLLTPLLIFVGVPPAVAVGSSANQLIAGSVTGVLGHMRKRAVDVRMGLVLVAGGIIGSLIGVWVFGLLKRIGQIDLIIQISYVMLLGTVGTLMGLEGLRAIVRRRRPSGQRRRLHEHYWMHGLPWKVRFPRSRLYISLLMPLLLGLGVGVLSAILGVGGGFIMVPAMIYLLGMPTQVVPGTSLLQVIFIAASVTFLQAVQNQTVDVMLALVLLVGGVIGSHLGSTMGDRLRGDQLRLLLALIVLATGAKLLIDLTLPPDDLYSVAAPTGT